MGGGNWIDQVLSPESLEKAGYFDAAAVAAAREKLTRPGRGVARTSLEMGLTAVTATQLWHHLYISGDLCELPSKVESRNVLTSLNGAPGAAALRV
jgi:asparagine synthase (glutamine-hydrolysing)